jgi:hypothetical protein
MLTCRHTTGNMQARAVDKWENLPEVKKWQVKVIRYRSLQNYRTLINKCLKTIQSNENQSLIFFLEYAGELNILDRNDHYKSNHRTSRMRLEGTAIFTKHDANDNK